MKLTPFTLTLCCLLVACHAAADTEYDYEEEPAVQPAAPAAKPSAATKPGKLGSLLTPRSRAAGPLASRKSPAAPAAATSKPTTSTEQPAEQLEEDYEEGAEEGASKQQESAATTTTTTEAPKKVGRGGVVRPFRSNEDLLAALKRRRAQGITMSPPRDTTTQASGDAIQSKTKSQSSGRAKSGSANEVPKSTSRVRFGGARGKAGTTAAASPVQEEAQESRPEDVQVKPKAYRRG